MVLYPAPQQQWIDFNSSGLAGSGKIFARHWLI
ncbi:hypothetical protein EPYR_03922 [Erwinia pyrifoliae DSM 12163]|nr:hypothetical protein EPYR_03922 [Erwinia pyrifoliae DSM 12163]